MNYSLSSDTKHNGQSTFIQNMYPFNPALSIYHPNDSICQFECTQESNRSEWAHTYPNTSLMPINKGQQISIIQQQHSLQAPIANTPLLSSPSTVSSSSTVNSTPIMPPEVLTWNLLSDADYLKSINQPVQQYNVATTSQAITNNIYHPFSPTQPSPFYGIAQQVVSTSAATMPHLCNPANQNDNPIGEPPSCMVSSCIPTKIEEIGCISDGNRQLSTTFPDISKPQLMNHKTQLDQDGHSSLLNWVSDDPSKPNVPQDNDKKSDGHQCHWINCCIVTASLEELITHVRETHIGGGKAVYHCEWMGCPRNKKPFMKRHKMHNHLRTHTGERPYVCTIADCDKRFSRPDSLNTHIRTHSNIRPYLCSVDGCGKAYFHSRSLRKHVKGHEAAGIFVPRPASRVSSKKKPICASPNPSLSPTSITSSSTTTLSPTSITIPLVLPSHSHFVSPSTWVSSIEPHDYTVSHPISSSPGSISTPFHAQNLTGSPMVPTSKMLDPYGYYYHPSSLL